MSSLEARKKLLIAEIELERAQFLADMASVTTGVRTLADRAFSLGSIASVGTLLVAVLAAFRRRKPLSVSAAAQPSWFPLAVKGAGLITSLWSAFRSRRG